MRFYASADPTITGDFESPFTPDVFLGSRFVDSLAPGQCDTSTTEAYALPATGAFYLGAIVDETRWVPELIESNNHTTGALIGVGNLPLAAAA